MYLSLPTDVAYERISAARLTTPLNREPPKNDPEVEASAVEYIYKLVKEADGDVAVLIDACAIRHRVKKELRDFLDKTQFPAYAAPMGKTAIDEDYPRYGGVCCLGCEVTTPGGSYSTFRFTSGLSATLKSSRRLKVQN